MEKKRNISNSRFTNQGWITLSPDDLANLYSVKYTYTPTKRVIIDSLLNDLHETQLNFIDEAVDKSDLKEANEIINYIKNK